MAHLSTETKEVFTMPIEYVPRSACVHFQNCMIYGSILIMQFYDVRSICSKLLKNHYLVDCAIPPSKFPRCMSLNS